MTEPTTPVEPDDTLLVGPDQNLPVFARLERLMSVRAQIDLLVNEGKQLTMELAALLPRSALFPDQSGRQWRATVVRPDDTVLVNLDRVLSMRPELYHRITKVDLDRTALNRALRAGAIDREVAEAAMSLRPNSPSVRLTPVDADTAGDEEET